jgi:hypothetical protein
MRRYLVVANQTVVSRELEAHIVGRLRGGDCSFHVIVPATPVVRNGTWTQGRACADARDRLDRALKLLADLGADASGEVGDASPMAAIAEGLRTPTTTGSSWPRSRPVGRPGSVRISRRAWRGASGSRSSTWWPAREGSCHLETP